MLFILYRKQKFLIIYLLLLAVIFPYGVSAMNWKKMTLNISNIDISRSGDIVVMVFQEDGFPKQHKKAINTYILDSTKAKQTLSITVPEEDFAIKVHHDENNDRKVTKNWTGFIPSEGLGFSSNAKVKFGPPSFKKAKIRSPQMPSHSIKLNYP